MPGNTKDNFSLPANLLFAKNNQAAFPQVARINLIDNQKFIPNLRGERTTAKTPLKDKYQIFEKINKRSEEINSVEKKEVPVIFYFVVDRIQTTLEASKLKIDPKEIALKLAEIWPEIISRLENKVADPSIFFGTDIFYDICLRAYLYQLESMPLANGKIQYSEQMLNLFNEINSLGKYLPKLYLNNKMLLGLNESLLKNNLNALDSLSQLPSNVNNNTSFPPLSTKDDWLEIITAWRVNNVGKGSAPDDFNQFSSILELMKTRKNECLLTMVQSLFFFRDKHYWLELEKLLWCYANALIYNKNEKNGDFAGVEYGQNVMLTTLIFFCFNESESIISKDFVELFYGKNVDKSLLAEVLESFKDTQIDIEQLISALSAMSLEERSDWIEGVLFLHVLEKGKIGTLNDESVNLLADIKSNIFTQPLFFSYAYRSIEDKYRERFKACSVFEKGNYENVLQIIYNNVFGKLSENGYANRIIYLMNLSIEKNKKTWNQATAWFGLCVLEIIFDFYQSVLEFLAWAWNHPLQSGIALASLIIFGVFDVIAVLEQIGLEDMLNDLYEYADEAFGYIGGYILIRYIASCIQKAVTFPLNHLAHGFNYEEFKQDLGIAAAKSSAHNATGFDRPAGSQYMPSAGKAYDDIICAIQNTNNIADLTQQYEVLDKCHALSDQVMDTMRSTLLTILYSEAKENKNNELFDTISKLEEHPAKIAAVILNHRSKIQKFFSSTTSAYINFVKTRAKTGSQNSQAAAALYDEAKPKTRAGCNKLIFI